MQPKLHFPRVEKNLVACEYRRIEEIELLRERGAIMDGHHVAATKLAILARHWTLSALILQMAHDWNLGRYANS